MTDHPPGQAPGRSLQNLARALRGPERIAPAGPVRVVPPAPAAPSLLAAIAPGAAPRAHRASIALPPDPDRAAYPPPWTWPALHRPEDAAIRHDGAVTTFAALDAAARDLSAALAARAIGRGDVVAFLGHNHPSQIVALMACSRLGAALLPLNWRLAPPELGFILQDAAARLVLALPGYAPLAESLAPPGMPPGDYVMDPTAPLPAGQAGVAPGTAEDPALVVYTSGTTGRPKGAVLDGAAVVANARNAVRVFDLTAEDHVLTVLPMFHVGGLCIQTLPALMVGATVTLHSRFDAEAWFDAVEREGPSLSLLVPAIMAALIAHPNWAGADLSALRAVGAGSSDVPAPLAEAFHAKGVPVQGIYGATETGPIALAQSPAEALADPGGIGRAAPLCEVRVQDEAGHPLPPGRIGEIAVRGPNLMRGYLRDPEGTAAAIRDGWFRTGDAAQLDASGRYRLAGRIGDVIISGGENVYPAEVERVLMTAPGITDGAVCGVPNPRWGEVPVAVVVPGPGYDPEAVLRHFEGKLARFKQPHHVVTVTALPRTALGKVERAALRALATA
ncbi:class I adenylate-forming enzyme family protein [Muricoccus radiodurans]|uniref:class I adenylate-forming enzyme family protein n=1 Tax=Muricoccus radiodurans TaxID=2231721 RepID=UPI003CECAFD2